MSIAVTCAGCGKSYKVDDSFAGKKAKCKGCGNVMVVPGGAPKAAAAIPIEPKPSASAGARRPSSSSKKPATLAAKAAPKEESNDFDFSALADIENTGTIDYSVQPTQVERPAEKVERPRYTAAPAHLRAAAAANGGRVLTSGRVATSTGGGGYTYGKPGGGADVAFWSWENLKPGVAGYVAIGLFVLGLVCLMQETMSFFGGGLILIIGFAFCAYGVIMPRRMALDEGAVVYLMYKFIPLYAFYFVVTRWYDAKKAVFAWIKGALLIVFGMLVWLHGGGIHRFAQMYVPRGGGNAGPSGPGVAINSSSDDDDDNDPNLTLAQKVARNHAKRKQAEIDAVPPMEFQVSSLPFRTDFPEIGQPDDDNGMKVWFYRTADGEFRGEPMDIHMILPANPKEPKPHSIPCIVMPTLCDDVLEGRTYTEEDIRLQNYTSRAGVATAVFDTSMFPLNRRPEDARSTIGEFISRDGGIDGARVAFNYLNSRVEAVDPKRVYLVGIRGSARIALTVAAAEPDKVAGVCVIDPVCDPEAHLFMPVPEMEKHTKAGGLKAFLDHSSPMKVADKIKCPIMIIRTRGGIAGASDEDIAAASAAPTPTVSEGQGEGASNDAAARAKPAAGDEVTRFVAAVKKAGGKVTVENFKPTPDTDEKEALMGRTARWVKEQAAKPVFSE